MADCTDRRRLSTFLLHILFITHAREKPMAGHDCFYLTNSAKNFLCLLKQSLERENDSFHQNPRPIVSFFAGRLLIAARRRGSTNGSRARRYLIDLLNRVCLDSGIPQLIVSSVSIHNSPRDEPG